MMLYEFSKKEDFLLAWKEMKKLSKEIKIYMPYPLEEVMEENDHETKPLNAFFFTGAIVGILTAILITVIPNVYTFPINIGGKPLLSWPAFIIIGFELMILFAGLAVVGGFFFLNDYPTFDKEVFGLKEFNERNSEHFFISTQKEFSGLPAFAVHHLPDPDSGV